jgi:hypothetical protein
LLGLVPWLLLLLLLPPLLVVRSCWARLGCRLLSKPPERLRLAYKPAAAAAGDEPLQPYHSSWQPVVRQAFRMRWQALHGTMQQQTSQ